VRKKRLAAYLVEPAQLTGASVAELSAPAAREASEQFELEVSASSHAAVAPPNLEGDRDVEWGFVAARLAVYARPGARVLDFGCGTGTLAFAAASLGLNVLAIDLMPRKLLARCPGLEFRQVDVMELDERNLFDLVINCSTIEHVGLSGRYNAKDDPDGDLRAMAKLRRLMRPDGHMLLTLPIGQDAVIRPLHRVYGPARLPLLLAGYTCKEATFWRKPCGNVWSQCSEPEALAERGSDHYYALGTLVLAGDRAA